MIIQMDINSLLCLGDKRHPRAAVSNWMEVQKSNLYPMKIVNKTYKRQKYVNDLGNNF